MPTPRITWSETRSRLAEDEARIRGMLRERFGVQPSLLLFDASWRCVALHRVAHYFWRRGARKTARLFVQLNSVITGADIHPNCDFGGGLLIAHPAALTASGDAGRNLTMMPLSGIGMLPREEDVGAGPGLPLLGDDVWLGAGCGVLGPVRLGSGARVQPGASLTRDAPPQSLVEMAAQPVPVEQSVEVLPADGTMPVAARDCDHSSWQATRRDIALDIARYLAMRGAQAGGEPGGEPRGVRRLSAALSTEVMGVAIHRIAHHLHCGGRPRLARAASAVNLFLHRITITPASCLGGGLFLPHPAGTVINATAGRDLTMYARSFCTSHAPALATGVDEGPVIGDRVVIAGMAAVLGRVAVGDDVHVGFNVQLREAVPAGHSAGSTVMRTRVSPLTPPEGEAVADPGPARRIAYSETRERLREDARRLRALHGGRTPLAARLCVIGFRHARYFAGLGSPRFARWCWWWTARLTGADIDPRSDIGAGFVVPNPAGVSIHVTAGRDLTVLALAAIGPQDARHALSWGTAGRPVLGDGVTVGEHAALHGPIRVGSGARIGPGCKVATGVAQGARLEMPGARLRRTAGAREEDA